MAAPPRHKTRASPRSRARYKSRGGEKRFADKTTLNAPSSPPGVRPGPQGEQADEDRTGRSIGRFGGAGEPPLPKK